MRVVGATKEPSGESPTQIEHSLLFSFSPAIASNAARIERENAWQSGHQFTPYQSTVTVSALEVVVTSVEAAAFTNARATKNATFMLFSGVYVVDP